MNSTYVDHMGSDLSVVKAARVSFSSDNVEFDKAKDEKLIKYLATHNHWTPFAHASITLRITAPVPIRTQCFKHKVGFSENEESRRYIFNEPTMYIPETFRKKPEGSIKQGSADAFPEQGTLYWKRQFKDLYSTCLNAYETAIDGGMCPEQARFLLPQGTQVSWYWTGSLAAYARFCKQRTDPHAQKEIQELAKEVSEIIEPLFPVSWKALIGNER